jgi:hypothetical protein
LLRSFVHETALSAIDSNTHAMLSENREIATVFLDNAMKLRRFTTHATKLFKLIPGDVGRPLSHLVTDLDYPEIYDDALEVLRRVPDGSLTFCYLLHPDPWPKSRHAKRRMMNDGPVDLIAAKLKPGGEFRFGTDHPVYVAHAMMVMRRHRHQFDWLANDASAMLNRPGGWPETRYEAKARRLGHEVWYFRYRRREG